MTMKEKADSYIEGMIVIDRARSEITFDGVVWEEIEEDHL